MAQRTFGGMVRGEAPAGIDRGVLVRQGRIVEAVQVQPLAVASVVPTRDAIGVQRGNELKDKRVAERLGAGVFVVH